MDNFVKKFHQLWKAGVTAHLDLDAHAGRAWVGLRVQLGEVPAGQVHRPPHRHRGPAYQRRQEKRKAARDADENEERAGQVISPTVEVSDPPPSDVDADENEELVGQVIPPTVEVSDPPPSDVDADDASKDQEGAAAEQADFLCHICDFRSTWTNGLSVHMTRKHANIEQLDGSTSVSEDLEEDVKYFRTKSYLKEGRLGTSYQGFLDANDIVEKSDLSDKSKNTEKAKILDARKCGIGSNFKHSPSWS